MSTGKPESISNTKRLLSVVIRVDGSKWIGMGHLTRCMDLLSEIGKSYSVKAHIVTRNSSAAMAYFKDAEFGVEYLPANMSKEHELLAVKRILDVEKPDLFIIDDLNSVYQRKLFSKNGKNVDTLFLVFTDATTKKLIDADIVVNLNPNQEKYDYSAIEGTTYCTGLDFFIAPEEYRKTKPIGKSRDKVNRVTVCMGGSDRRNVTHKVLTSLDEIDAEFSVDVIVRSDFYPKIEFMNFCHTLKRDVRPHFDTPGICSFLKNADIAITSGGNVHIERLMLGIPGIVICQSRRELEITKRIEKKEAVINLGLHNEVNDISIREACKQLLENRELRNKLSVHSKKYYDANGVTRIVKTITEHLQLNKTVGRN